MRNSYPSYITTDTERTLFDAREREQEVIRAMQRRAARNPIRDLMWRRPWRAPHGPNWRSARDAWQWLRAAHDCADPAVGCSCSGGFRFPADAGLSVARPNVAEAERPWCGAPRTPSEPTTRRSR